MNEVSSDEDEIAEMAARTIRRYFGRDWVNWTPELRESEAKRVILLVIQESAAIRKAKFLSELKEKRLWINEVPGGFYLMLGDEKLLHSIHDNLLPQMQRLVQLFSEPKESEEERQ